MTAAVSKAQIGAIHALKSRAGLDDESYRDVLRAVAGVGSAKALGKDGAIAVIDRLKVLAGQGAAPNDRPKARGALDLTGPYAGICRALWISGWQLGLMTDRADTALTAFVRRQTGLDSLNWLRDHEDAQAVIEALKDWLAREGGVRWPRKPTVRLPSGEILDLRKWAVVKAQLAKLGRPNERLAAGTDLDAMMSRLGAEIRRGR
jgi:hypothetical protein